MRKNVLILKIIGLREKRYALKKFGLRYTAVEKISQSGLP